MAGLFGRADPDDLVSFGVLDTGIYTTSNKLFTTYWKNQTGRRLKIVGASLWTGMFYGCRADISVSMSRDADGALMIALGWDHYAEPTSPQNDRLVWFHPYAFYLYPGDLLRMNYVMSLFQGLPGATHYGTIWCPAGG